MRPFFKVVTIALALVFLASFFFEGHPTTNASTGKIQPRPILKVKAGSRLIDVQGVPEKGVYVFQPFIERDDEALMTVLRTVIENQTGKPVAPRTYVSNGSPPWMVIGDPEHQFRVMIFKNTSDGEVFSAHIRPN